MKLPDRIMRRLPIPVLSLLTTSFLIACAVRLFLPSFYPSSREGALGLLWPTHKATNKYGAERVKSESIDLSDPEAPFVSWPLARVCNETKWVEGLVFVCDNNSGGVGNIRNYIQTCLRYAIEAGATGLVIPKIRKRSEKNLADLFTGYLPFDYMFDEQHFRDAFGASCPQVTLYDTEHNVTNIKSETEIEMIRPYDFGDRQGGNNIDQDRHTDRFGDRFRTWLGDGILPGKKTSGNDGKQPTARLRQQPSIDNPRLIRFEWGIIWAWPVFRDGPEFAATFGSVLKFNDKLLYLGKKALAQMRVLAHEHGGSGEFLGAHLRTESDALGFWPHYKWQSESYLQKAAERGFKSAYLATGNATEAEKFSEQAMKTLGIKVLTKEDLLTGQDYEDLMTLSWDQRAIVDYLMLLGSDYFVGVMPSSFSVYVAIRRHLRTDGIYTRPYKVGTEGDGLSFLVGKYEHYWDEWLFMFDGMWP